MMKLSISKCTKCNRARLVDNVAGKWICFACKQKMGRVAIAELQGKQTTLSVKAAAKMVVPAVQPDEPVEVPIVSRHAKVQKTANVSMMKTAA